MFPFRRGVRRLTPEQAHQRAAGHDGVVLLDVREPHEWQAGHAPGAVHAPLSELVAGGELPVTARSRPLVVICRSGQRSQQAAKLLAKRGRGPLTSRAACVHGPTPDCGWSMCAETAAR